MGGYSFQWESLGRQLGERELAGLVAVAARALDGDELHRHALEREVGELPELALHDDGAALALQGFHAEEDRKGAGAGGAVEHHVDALAAGDFLDARQRVFLLYVDDVI